MAAATGNWQLALNYFIKRRTTRVSESHSRSRGKTDMPRQSAVWRNIEISLKVSCQDLCRPHFKFLRAGTDFRTLENTQTLVGGRREGA